MVSFPDPRAGHPYHMHDMIRRQPEFVRETLERVRSSDPRGFLGRPARLLVTGCGTSFHAAMYGARLLDEALGPRVAVHAVQAYDLLSTPVTRRVTVLALSHSGNTPTTNLAIRRAKARGSRVLAVCGLPDTPMERIAASTLVIGSTHDRSWANTMSYTSQLAALAGLVARLSGNDRAIRAWRSLPTLVRRALDSEAAVRALAAPIASRDRVTFVGSDLGEITALEAALKIRETCSLPASAYQLEQLLHGPFLSIDDRETVVVLQGPADGTRADAICRAWRSTGANVVRVGPGQDIGLPRASRALLPIVEVIPMQFLAYFAALERGANPDIMRADVARFQEGLGLLFT